MAAREEVALVVSGGMAVPTYLVSLGDMAPC
jgi:hypothetical protein